jgi:hypothetical protein
MYKFLYASNAVPKKIPCMKKPVYTFLSATQLIVSFSAVAASQGEKPSMTPIAFFIFPPCHGR